MARRNDIPAAPNAMVAAAKRISIGRGATTFDRWALRSQEWMGEAWITFDEVPEVKHGVMYAGNAGSKVRMFAATRPKDDPDGEPVPVDDPKSTVAPDLAAAAMEQIARLSSSLGGITELQKTLVMVLEVSGLSYLVRWGPRIRKVRDVRDPLNPVDRDVEDPERFEIRSDREVEVKTEGEDRIVKVSDTPNGPQTALDSTKGDTVTPIWTRHAGWSGLADSNLRAALVDCRALQLLTGQVLAEAASAMPAQAWTIPNELTFSRAPATDPTADGEADPLDPLEAAIDAAWTEAVEDPTSMSTFRPFVIRGPAAYLEDKYLRVIDFKRGGGEELEKRIVARVERLARGLNLPVEVIMGHQGTTFANAEQVDQDTFEDYLQPRVEMMCDAFTIGHVHPELVAAGFDVDQVSEVFVWYDASRLVAQPDAEKNANDAHDRFLISDTTYRRVKGFSDDDAPTVEEQLARAGLKRGIFTSDVSVKLLEFLGTEIDVEPLPDAPAVDAPAADSPEAAAIISAMLAALPAGARLSHLPRPITAASRGRTRSDLGRRLMDIDRELRTRLVVAADAAMVRGLERAGARMRAKNGPHRQLVRDIENVRVCAHLGRQVVTASATPEELVDDAFDALETQFMEWGRGSQGEAVDLVYRTVAGFTEAERDALQVRMVSSLSEAWGWLRTSLRALAHDALFGALVDPGPGEFDATTSIPAGIVRHAMALAGGGHGLTTTDQGGAFVSLGDAGRRPAGGIGTGEVLRDSMRDHGVGVEGYVWVYGPAHRTRPFDLHVALDGVSFTNFDDPVLANPASFPEFDFLLPGDHAGCVCDVAPTLLLPDE